MIGPYGSAIELYVTRLSGLGYLKSSDTDYEVVFSNGAYRVSFSTEKYYHPSVAVTLIDATGEKFVMAFVREILAPGQFAKELEELKGVRSRYHLDGQGTDKHTRAAGIEAYMSLIAEHVCSFLSALGGDKLTADETFLTRYRELERARFKPFGLQVQNERPAFRLARHAVNADGVRKFSPLKKLRMAVATDRRSYLGNKV